MIVFDTETNALTVPDVAPLDQQPHILEFAGIKLDDKRLTETARLEFLCSMGRPLAQEELKVNRITNEMLHGIPPFAAHLKKLTDFFFGEWTMVAHNLPYDANVLRYELIRLDRVTRFPWPPNWICTVEASISLRGHRLKLSELYAEATGSEHKDAHRAMPDTEALVACVRWLRKKRLL